MNYYIDHPVYIIVYYYYYKTKLLVIVEHIVHY